MHYYQNVRHNILYWAFTLESCCCTTPSSRSRNQQQDCNHQCQKEKDPKQQIQESSFYNLCCLCHLGTEKLIFRDDQHISKCNTSLKSFSEKQQKPALIHCCPTIMHFSIILVQFGCIDVICIQTYPPAHFLFFKATKPIIMPEKKHYLLTSGRQPQNFSGMFYVIT